MGLQNNVQKVTLDFNNPNIKTLRFHQYDKDARKIVITFTNLGQIVPIDASTTEARIKWLKPDGYPVFNDAIINTDGTVTVICTEQMLIADGIGHAEIMLLEKSSEKVLHSMPVKAVIQKSVYCHCKLTSTAEFDALVHILLKIREAERIIEKFPEWEAAENARKQAELAREQAEKEREKNTAIAIANANTAADNANNAAINADDAANNAIQATQDANNAIDKMNHKLAEAQGVINEARQAIIDISNTEQDIKDAEADRVNAENKRQQDFDKKMNDADQKISEMNKLIDDCSDALENATDALDRADKANDTADETIEKLKVAIESIKDYKGNQTIISVTQPESQDIDDIWFIETER